MVRDVSRQEGQRRADGADVVEPPEHRHQVGDEIDGQEHVRDRAHHDELPPARHLLVTEVASNLGEVHGFETKGPEIHFT